MLVKEQKMRWWSDDWTQKCKQTTKTVFFAPSAVKKIKFNKNFKLTLYIEHNSIFTGLVCDCPPKEKTRQLQISLARCANSSISQLDSPRHHIDGRCVASLFILFSFPSLFPLFFSLVLLLLHAQIRDRWPDRANLLAEVCCCVCARVSLVRPERWRRVWAELSWIEAALS